MTRQTALAWGSARWRACRGVRSKPPNDRWGRRRRGSRSRGTSLGMLPREPTSQRHEVAAQFFERKAQRVSFCDQHHVVARGKMSPLLAKHLAHQALDAVALMSAADLPGYGDPQPRRSQRWGLALRRDLARRGLRNSAWVRTHDTHQLLCRAPSVGLVARPGPRRHKHEEVAGVVFLAPTLDAKKLPALAQPQPTRESLRLHRAKDPRNEEPADPALLGAAAHREALATFAATVGQNFAAVLGRHASAETVRTFAASVVRLVGTFGHDAFSCPRWRDPWHPRTPKGSGR